MFTTIFIEKHKDCKHLVGILIGSVGILIFSVGILILSVGILIFVVGIMKLLRNCRDYDCRDFDCRDSETLPLNVWRFSSTCLWMKTREGRQAALIVRTPFLVTAVRRIWKGTGVEDTFSVLSMRSVHKCVTI